MIEDWISFVYSLSLWILSNLHSHSQSLPSIHWTSWTMSESNERFCESRGEEVKTVINYEWSLNLEFSFDFHCWFKGHSREVFCMMEASRVYGSSVILELQMLPNNDWITSVFLVREFMEVNRRFESWPVIQSFRTLPSLTANPWSFVGCQQMDSVLEVKRLIFMFDHTREKVIKRKRQ